MHVNSRLMSVPLSQCIYTRIYVYMYVCMYIHTYIHTYINTCKHTQPKIHHKLINSLHSVHSFSSTSQTYITICMYLSSCQLTATYQTCIFPTHHYSGSFDATCCLGCFPLGYTMYIRVFCPRVPLLSGAFDDTLHATLLLKRSILWYICVYVYIYIYIYIYI